WFDSALLWNDGLVYAVNSVGILRVLDFTAGKQVYEQQLDVHAAVQYVVSPGVSANPAIAGKYLYVLDNQNTMVVVETGRTYKPVAKNTIHYQAGAPGWG